jgi:acyl-CoA dehydrogenase
MTSTDDRDLDLVRRSARELARRFDLGYWREKDKKGSTPGSSSRRSPTAAGWGR